jgi:hypothetical protein
VDPDSSSSVTDPTSGTGTTGGTTTTTGDDSTTGTELCEVMIPPPGECPFAAPVGERRLLGGSPAAHHAELDLEAEPDEVQGGGFIPPPDVGVGTECDLWTQDCPEGEKCMPWANDGGNSWNATRCSPLEPDAGGPGEPCTVEGSGVSGIDDCQLGAMCWNVDGETNMGECAAFCIGDEANPSCANECEQCFISGSGVLILCLPQCDPIAQDCGEGSGCYPDFQSFSCGPDVSGEAGAVGEPCEFVNACDPGSACIDSDLVPGCEDPTGCCAPFCDVDGPPVCDALLPGSSCLPWEGGQPAEACVGPGTIGVCSLPQ